MCRGVKLREDPDAPPGGVPHDVLHIPFIVGLFWTVSPEFGECRERIEIEGEALRVCYVPVKHVHLGITHGVDEGPDHVHRDEVPEVNYLKKKKYLTTISILLPRK